MDDENRKKAKQATDRLMLQTKAKEFQDKLKDQRIQDYHLSLVGLLNYHYNHNNPFLHMGIVLIAFLKYQTFL